MKFHLLLLVGLLSGSAAFAQYGPNTRHADIRGQGGGPGQCFVELEVDHLVEIELRGDDGLIRTIEGSPGEWHRFECTRRLPRNPVNFRFRGVRGRGRQQLMRPPGDGEPAVIRIEDPQNGAGEYAFEVDWDGGAGDWGPAVPPPGPPPGAWTGDRGSTFNFHGDGRGRFVRDGREMPVRDVNVRLERDGDVILDFEVEGFRRLVFRGTVDRWAGDSIVAQLNSTGADRDTRGGATIYVERSGQVSHIDMGGRADGGQFRLDWYAQQDDKRGFWNTVAAAAASAMWTGNQGSTFNYHGDGRGRFVRDEREMRVHDVNVRLERDGDVFLDFEAEGFRRLQFRGHVERYNPDSVVVQLASTGGDPDTRGGSTIYIDRGGQVERIDMGGRIEGRNFRLDWNAH